MGDARYVHQCINNCCHFNIYPQRKRNNDADADMHEWAKKPKLDIIIGKCKMEENCPKQPLFIDEADETIKCSWCPTWGGSGKTKVINQHVKTAASHQKARKKLLDIDDSPQPGQQLDIRFFCRW